MQNNISNNIYENGFGTTLHSIIVSVECKDKLMNFQVFEKL